jgi:hypothetical protein
MTELPDGLAFRGWTLRGLATAAAGPRATGEGAA